MRRNILLAALIAAAALSACENARNGNQTVNQAPLVSLANIPANGSRWSVNPEVFWFGSDLDGIIDSFQYAVVPVDTAYYFFNTDSADVPALYNVDYNSLAVAEWTTVSGTVSQARILMPGPEQWMYDTTGIVADSLYRPCYFVLRAIDNEDSISTRVGRLFFRKNNVPETEISKITDNGVVVDASNDSVFFVLPETTATWEGVKIEWKGSDPLDVRRGEPVLTYRYELMNAVDSTVVFTSASVTDSLYTGRKILTLGLDSNTHSIQSGVYTFRVWSRDDALVEDTSAAEVTFRLVRPAFNPNNVVIVNENTGLTQRGNMNLAGAVPLYDTLATELGYDVTIHSVAGAPPDTLLGTTGVVWWVDDDVTDGVDPGEMDAIAAYLNVGGNLLLAGRGTLKNYGTTGQFNEFGSGNWPYDFLGLSGVQLAFWSVADTVNGRTEQFVGAVNTPGFEQFPTFEVDSARVDSSVQWWTLPPPIRVPTKGRVPQIGYFTWNPGGTTSTIYRFVADDTTHDYNGRPVGVAFDGGTFKSMTLDFVIFFVEGRSVQQAIIQEALEWLLQ